MKTIFIIIISFTIHINSHYSTIAANIFDINNRLKYDRELSFKDINYYNDNKSLSFNLNHKNNLKIILKDKYNYIVGFNIYKYKFQIFLRSKPIQYNYTEIDIDIRQNKVKLFNHNSLNFNHYNRVNNIIYKYIYNNIILKNNEEMSVELFRFFNNY